MRLLPIALCLLAAGAAADPDDLRPLLDFADPEGTETRLRALLPAAREAGDAGRLAEILTQIARTYSRRGDFAQAHRILDEAEPLLADDHPRARVRYWLERGRRFNAVYGYVYEELAELYHRAGDPRAAAYFGLAYEALSQDVWMVNSQSERLARLKRLGGR